MICFVFDQTLDGLLTAVFDAYALRLRPDALVGEGQQLPLFCEQLHHVATADDKARRVWTALERRLPADALRLMAVSWQSEDPALSFPLFNYIYKVFSPSQGAGIERNFTDPDVLHVTNTARRVMHERLRMMQFIRFQKAKDGTYLSVVSPDHDVLPLVVDHFSDRFGDQQWLIFDAKRHYGYYFDRQEVLRITFEDEDALPFSLADGKLDAALLSDDDQLLQRLWRTYFKAICIRERTNPKKQLNDMPRRYWKYMTEKQ